MNLEIECMPDTVVARLIGDIDHHEAKSIREAIDEAVTRSGAAELELDFKDVSFMDSSGIGLVMGRYKLMEEMGGTLRLVNVASHLKKVMVIAGLDNLFPIGRDVRKKPPRAKRQETSTYHGVPLFEDGEVAFEEKRPEEPEQTPDLNMLCSVAAKRAAGKQAEMPSVSGANYKGVPLIEDEPQFQDNRRS